MPRPALPSSPLKRLATLGLATVVLASGLAQAQIYRFVDAQGRVTFSDTPPADDGTAQVVTPNSTAAPSANLPAALRQPMQRFPVTLYSAPDCAPCDSGRQQLNARGIPFAEKTIESQADVAAFRQLGGGDRLPTLGIGQQMLSGHADTEWARLLDAAGYPEQSALPPGWQNTPASPLAPPIPPPQPAAEAPAQANSSPESPITPQASPDNPAGLRF